MKAIDGIQRVINAKEKNLVKEQAMYDNMTQIEMQGGWGAQVLENINVLKGEIKALKWVIEPMSISV